MATMINLHLQLESPAQLAAVAAALGQIGIVPAVAAANVVLPAEDKPAKKAKPAPAAEAPPAPTPEEAVADAAPVAEPTVTLEQVRAKLGEITQSGKRAEVKALLEKHGAAKLTDLDKAQYAAVLADAEAL
jgi:hypothetical protein